MVKSISPSVIKKFLLDKYIEDRKEAIGKETWRKVFRYKNYGDLKTQVQNQLVKENWIIEKGYPVNRHPFVNRFEDILNEMVSGGKTLREEYDRIAREVSGIEILEDKIEEFNKFSDIGISKKEEKDILEFAVESDKGFERAESITEYLSEIPSSKIKSIIQKNPDIPKSSLKFSLGNFRISKDGDVIDPGLYISAVGIGRRGIIGRTKTTDKTPWL